MNVGLSHELFLCWILLKNGAAFQAVKQGSVLKAPIKLSNEISIVPSKKTEPSKVQMLHLCLHCNDTDPDACWESFKNQGFLRPFWVFFANLSISLGKISVLFRIIKSKANIFKFNVNLLLIMRDEFFRTYVLYGTCWRRVNLSFAVY